MHRVILDRDERSGDFCVLYRACGQRRLRLAIKGAGLWTSRPGFEGPVLHGSRDPFLGPVPLTKCPLGGWRMRRAA